MEQVTEAYGRLNKAFSKADKIENIALAHVHLTCACELLGKQWKEALKKPEIQESVDLIVMQTELQLRQLKKAAEQAVPDNVVVIQFK